MGGISSPRSNKHKYGGRCDIGAPVELITGWISGSRSVVLERGRFRPPRVNWADRVGSGGCEFGGRCHLLRNLRAGAPTFRPTVRHQNCWRQQTADCFWKISVNRQSLSPKASIYLEIGILRQKVYCTKIVLYQQQTIQSLWTCCLKFWQRWWWNWW